MPESGWLSPRDLDSIDRQRAAGEVLLNDGYRDKLLHLRLDADRRGALPPLAERACMYGSESWCAGPAAEGQWQRACDCCARERDEYLRLHPEPEPEPTPTTTDLNASIDDSAANLTRPSGTPKPPGAPPLSPQSATGWVTNEGFVSGHDFSRAEKRQIILGLQPLRRILRSTLVRAPLARTGRSSAPRTAQPLRRKLGARPTTRAVGATGISPALQRWEIAKRKFESRRDGAANQVNPGAPPLSPQSATGWVTNEGFVVRTGRWVTV